MKKEIIIKTPFLTLTFIFCFIFLFPNDFKSLIPNGGILLSGLTLFFLFIEYIIHFPKLMEFIKNNILFSIPVLITFISTYLYNGNNIYLAFLNILYLLIIYFLAFFSMKEWGKIINIAEVISFMILVINLLVFIILKHPLSYSASGGRIYFIFDGSIGKLLMANMLLFFISNNMPKKGRLIHIIIYLLSIYSILFSATNSFGCIILLIYMIFCKHYKNNFAIFKYTKFIIFVILFLNLLVITGSLSPILSTIFHKSITLSGRTIIWDSVIEIIKSFPIIGIGLFDSDFFIKLTGVAGATHAHNQILQILLNCGVLGLIPYIYYLSKIKNIKKYINYNPNIKYYIGYLLIIIIMCATGCFFDEFFYLSFLIFVNYINKIKKLEGDKYEIS